MDLEKAIEHAWMRNAILFLGSGFSVGGKNITGTCLKVGAGLSHVICDDLGIERSDNLTISADRYLNDEQCKKSLEELIELLKRECMCVEASTAQEVISILPWHRIYTTNYDNMFELCSKKNGYERKTITVANRRYSKSQRLDEAIIHINGYIETINKDTFFDEFKITDESYTRNGFLESAWRNLFENDLQSSKAIVFVGYSLQYDQDIVRCIAQQEIKEKCLFIDVEGISKDAAYKLRRYGRLELIGTEGLAEKIKIIKKPEITESKIELHGIEELTEEDYQCEDNYSSNDVFLLLAKGVLQRQYLSQKRYCVHNYNAIKNIKREIGSKKIIIVQSYLGNGKTIFLECLAYALTDKYRVYNLKNTDTLSDDMDIIQSTSSDESVLLIDDVDKYRYVLRQFGKDFPDKLTVIATCRTATNTHLYYNLVESYGFEDDDVYIYDLDDMDNDAVNELCQVLNNSRLWGKYDTLSNAKKRKMIINDYKSQLSRVFYLLLESTSIENEIKEIISFLNDKMKLRDFLLAHVINSVCQLKFTQIDIYKFINIDSHELNNYLKFDKVKELILKNHDLFYIRSTIYLQYMLNKADFSNDIMTMMLRIFRKCSISDEEVKRYENQRRTMVSRSDILLVLSGKNTPTSSDEKRIFDYYDEIKSLPTAKNNPFFWLQFAITALNMNRYDLSNVFFKNAYSNAKRIADFNTYQIDTHYARLLLLQEINENHTKIKQALETFYKAYDLLYKNCRMGKLDYSLRQTGLFFDYYNMYQVNMSDDEKNEFLHNSIKFIEVFMEYFKENGKGTYNVRDAYKKYRKLFCNNTFKLQIKECDTLFGKISMT